MSTDSRYNVVFVLGGPGAGKGTQCQLIQKEFGYVHLSAGELLRNEQNTEGSEYSKEIDNHIRNGTIVPVKITCALLYRAMQGSGKHNFLIDGFPRNKDNLDGWNTEMDKVAKIQCVLFFNCPDQVCVERCLKRGKTSGRTDDNEESLKKRIETYYKSTLPIIAHYKSLNLVAEIHAEQDKTKVFQDVKTVFENFKNS
ncbi:UMP-CMP kinase 2-like [Gigantopelta aegis]|uniref:UMP-CMP kinase 2-like n=1 Tax=Gigantopelta aegis TaxID=1735272 RepID=UPI001B889C4D|nr:UMP-CMP kinase 2-like [Gigantopelta aegis]